MDAKSVLSTTESLLTTIASTGALPAPWGLVLSALGAAAGLAADLAAHGFDPGAEITEMRSAVPAFAAGRQSLRDYLETKAR